MSVQQDGRQVNCTIVDKSGPILGANVVVKGTTIGNISDMDGRAIIDNVPANAVLVVSYIGYVTQEVHLKDKSDFYQNYISRRLPSLGRGYHQDSTKEERHY